jgi:tetratricopeptide (TPR) repeat protein
MRTATDDELWQSHYAAGTQAYLRGHYAEAEEHFSAARQAAEPFGPDDYRLAASLAGLGQASYDQCKYGDAEPLLQRALAIAEAAKPGHPDVARALYNYADLLRRTGRAAQAAEFQARARAILANHTLPPSRQQ